tara:strand:- start:208 stop:573 length:366 start_codon:yes stop_codon:yes gene_type:complete
VGYDRHEILDRSVLYYGINRLTRLLYRYRKCDGDWNAPFEWETFQRGPAAAILPYDPVHDAIVMVEKFRPSALLSGENPWQVEPIAGICDVAKLQKRRCAGRQWRKPAARSPTSCQPARIL